MTLFLNSVTDRSCINRTACNSHSDNKKPIPGTHVDNKMCDCRPLHSVISGSICVAVAMTIGGHGGQGGPDGFGAKEGKPVAQRVTTTTT